MMLEPSMKFFLACVTTTLAICVTAASLHAFDEESAGQIRLSDQGSIPQPVPHVIGSGGPAGQAIVGGGYTLPNRPVYYDNMLNANIGYQMSEDIFTVQYRVEHRAGGLQGYNDGYTDFGAFIPMMTSANSLFFTDIRGIVTNDSDGGLNVGFGRRWYDPNGDRVWSGSAWYGYDGGNVNSYQNLGLSASMTSRYWRYRVNGYGVVSDQSNFIGTQIDNTNPFLLTDEIHLNRTRIREAAYHGVDATIGGPMPLLGRFGINWDTGVYYNWANDGEPGDDGLGWMFSSDAQLTEDVNLAVRYTNDNIFGANAQLSLAVNIPDGRPSRILRQSSVRDYMLRQDERKYRSSVKRYDVNDTVALLNATDNLPIKVANIIPAATAGVIASGDGTIENPFNTTAAWEALSGAAKAEFDIVLVRPGVIPAGADYMNNLTSGMTIVENQRLLSSTGRLVRTLGTSGNELYSYAGHSVLADVTGLGTGLTFTIPQTGELLNGTSLIGTIFDPTNDPRPILANHTNVVSTRPHAVVAIDNSFSVACATNTEVSGFIIDATNPNMPTTPNNGIVTGNILNPALGTGVTGFDINSNFIRDAVHGIHITSLGDSFGTILLNRVEGDGFNSNSGINIFHSGGALGLRFEDNLAYNIFGEDIDNNGVLDIPGGVPGGTEDVNGNGTLDIGEDLDGDGVIDVFEDNDQDGILGDDDLGIGFNIVADSVGATIFSNDTANNLHIVRNVTHLEEAQYFRTQTLDANGNVINAYTAQDINHDITLILPANVIQSSDILDNVGNKNGMNLEARDGASVFATVADNDTSFNNAYEAGLMPPVKNPFLSVIPTPLGNEFGLRVRAIGVGSVMTLSSPDRHLSNNNFGHGAILEALNNSTLTMTSPMQGAFTTDATSGLVTSTTPSEYNENGLNGLLINGDNNSLLTIQVGDPSTAFDHTLTDPADQNTRNYFSLNQFNRNGQDGDAATVGNGIEIRFRSGATFAPGSNSGIFHATITDNVDHGILVDVENTTFNNFTIYDSIINGNQQDGILVSADTTPIDTLRITDSIISNNGVNGINFQLLNSNMSNLFVENNLINGNGNLIAQNPVSAFNIDVIFGGGLTPSQQAAFAIAASRWEQLIIGDVPDVGAIDDLSIAASGVAIDGVGGTLGQAGPTDLRAGTNIPYQGIMQFDSADLANLESSGQLVDVILHEMGHVLGIGTVWSADGLLLNPSGGDGVTDTRFTGVAGTAEYNTRFAVAEPGVPVENTGGPGTADSHWRESVFSNELMTGILNAGVNPISRTTTASLQDLGYVVNLNASDAYLVAPATSVTIDMEASFINNIGPVSYAVPNPIPVNLVVVDPNVNGNGINISIQGGNLSNAVIENNILDSNTGDGIRFRDPQFATNAEGDNQIHYKLNTISNNGGYGINMSLNLTNHLDSVICANDISGNTLGGVNVELSDDSIYHNGLVPPATLLTPAVDEESWFFGNTIDNNGGIGYHIAAAGNSQFSMIGTASAANTLNGNQDAGIGIEMSGNVVGDIRLDNITVDGTQDADAGGVGDTNTNFDGEGIGIVLNDNSILNNMRIGDPIVINPANPGTARTTNVTNNLNNGISIVTSGNTSLQETLIANTNISGNGTNGTGDGINVVRNQTSIVGDDADVLPALSPIAAANTNLSPIAPIAVATTTVISNTVPDAPADAFVIRDSTINNNGGDGIDLTANLANINDEYLIEQNDISGNGANGVRLFAQGDAEMLVDIRYSTINNNGSNGIQTTANLNNITDEVSITGTWVGLQIDGNTSNGVQLNGIFGDLNAIIRPLQIGSNFTEDVNANGLLDPGEDLDGDGRLDSDAVFITNNGAHGIDIPGSGTYAIYNTLIDGNGQSGVNATFTSNGFIDRSVISNNTLHGINLASTGFFNNMSLTMTNSLIEGNTRDGLQLSVNPGGNALINFTGAANPVLEVTMDTNVVRNNGGRGIDTTVQGDGSASLDINNIVVTGNGEQGIYNLITASTTQDLEASAATALAQDGSLFANAFLDFTISADAGFDITSMVPGQAVGQNLIANNGLTDSYDGGGLVFRVGTTGAISGLLRPFENANTVDPTALGGLVASIEDVNMIGNNGVDFWIHTFVSTVDPSITGGAWSDQNTDPRDAASDVYTPTGFEQDPLARIQIDAASNLTGGSVDVFGRSISFTTGSNQNFAFYNTNEPVFKSRTQGQDNATDSGLDDDGPFNSATRPRNATRLASRTGFTTYDTDLFGVTTTVAGASLVPDLTIFDAPLDSDNFLYPGIGQSTLRISSGADFDFTGDFTNVINGFANEVGFSQTSGLLFFRDVNFLWDTF